MKLLLSTAILAIIIISQSFAQWTHQNSGTSERFLSNHFIDETTGWAAGDNGTIVKTTNGGMDWVSLNIGALQDIHALFFIDSLVGGQ